MLTVSACAVWFTGINAVQGLIPGKHVASLQFYLVTPIELVDFEMIVNRVGGCKMRVKPN